MAEAEVGDDVLDGDPTVGRLEERTAALLGKEAALFFPTGTMANQTAIWLLARPGTEILVDANSHIVHLEMAGASAFAGVQLRLVPSHGAMMDAVSFRQTIRPHSVHTPAASLVCIENTHNGAGGRVTPLSELRAMSDVAREHDLPVHLDGARLWNAAAATGTGLAEFAACADTVMVSFSKGLGAPVGAALAGAAPLIAGGRSARRRFGGGMRQSGIIAAGALYGLEHNLARLPEDHDRARRLAASVDGVAGARVVAPDTNIVMIDLPPGIAAGGIVKAAAEHNVLVSEWTPTRIRAVTHLDIGDPEVKRAGEVLVEVLEAIRPRSPQ
jgi:threonine aldolase